jgi:hypothetical protein
MTNASSHLSPAHGQVDITAVTTKDIKTSGFRSLIRFERIKDALTSVGVDLNLFPTQDECQHAFSLVASAAPPEQLTFTKGKGSTIHVAVYTLNKSNVYVLEAGFKLQASEGAVLVPSLTNAIDHTFVVDFEPTGAGWLKSYKLTYNASNKKHLLETVMNSQSETPSPSKAVSEEASPPTNVENKTVAEKQPVAHDPMTTQDVAQQPSSNPAPRMMTPDEHIASLHALVHEKLALQKHAKQAAALAVARIVLLEVKKQTDARPWQRLPSSIQNEAELITYLMTSKGCTPETLFWQCKLVAEAIGVELPCQHLD